MAQYNVKAGCGHATTVSLVGPMHDRERRLEWMRSASGMCNPCYAASKREQEQARTAEQVNVLRDQVIRQYGSIDAVPNAVWAKVRSDLDAGLGTEDTRR